MGRSTPAHFFFISRRNNLEPGDTVEELSEVEAAKLDTEEVELAAEEVPIPTFVPSLLPMQETSYDNYKQRLTYPLLVQPNIIGIRCLYDGTYFWDENGSIICNNAVKHLTMDTSELIFDGVLALPLSFTKEDTVLAAKKFIPKTKPKDSTASSSKYYSAMLEFNVIDYACSDKKSFHDRYIELTMLSWKDATGFKLAPTYVADTNAKALACVDEFKRAGFSGGLIRCMRGIYTAGTRSFDMQVTS